MEINNHTLIKEVATETGIPVHIVDKVIRSIFEFIRMVIKRGKMESVRLIHFGIFVAKSKINYNINKTNEQDG